jgi:hypothetical protein
VAKILGVIGLVIGVVTVIWYGIKNFDPSLIKIPDNNIFKRTIDNLNPPDMTSKKIMTPVLPKNPYIERTIRKNPTKRIPKTFINPVRTWLNHSGSKSSKKAIPNPRKEIKKVRRFIKL